MRQQESLFRGSMNSANAAMSARSTAASDWVDYALDQQIRDRSGWNGKGYNRIFSDVVERAGQGYQTNHPNANPHGAM
jgi:hypothetical protein